MTIIDHLIFVGISTRAALRKLLKDGDITPSDELKFYQSEGLLCPSNEIRYG